MYVYHTVHRCVLAVLGACYLCIYMYVCVPHPCIAVSLLVQARDTIRRQPNPYTLHPTPYTLHPCCCRYVARFGGSLEDALTAMLAGNNTLDRFSDDCAS